MFGYLSVLSFQNLEFTYDTALVIHIPMGMLSSVSLRFTLHLLPRSPSSIYEAVRVDDGGDVEGTNLSYQSSRQISICLVNRGNSSFAEAVHEHRIISQLL
jgi:hypothetical protein